MSRILDGTDDHGTVPNSATLASPSTAITVALWAKMATNGQWATVCGKQNSGFNFTWGVFAINSSNSYEAWLNNGSAEASPSGTVTSDEWRLMVVRWQSGSGPVLRFYRPDGTIDVQVTGSSFTGTLSSGAGSLFLGSFGGVDFWAGKLGRSAIYDASLSDAELVTLAEGGDMLALSPAAAWSLTTSGTTEPDLTGNGNTLTWTGATFDASDDPPESSEPEEPKSPSAWGTVDLTLADPPAEPEEPKSPSAWGTVDLTLADPAEEPEEPKSPSAWGTVDLTLADPAEEPEEPKSPSAWGTVDLTLADPAEEPRSPSAWGTVDLTVEQPTLAPFFYRYPNAPTNYDNPQPVGLVRYTEPPPPPEGGLWSELYGASPSGHIEITDDVVLDMDATVDSLTVSQDATLTFDPSKSVTLQSRGNVVIESEHAHGHMHDEVAFSRLVMKPSSYANVHTLRFIDVHEDGYIGRGMTVVDSDIGLWCVDSLLDLQGSYRNPWTNLTGGVSAGATQVTVVDAGGWQIGDSITIVPTQSPALGDVSWDGYDTRTITAKSGNVLTLSSPLTYAHPENSFHGFTHRAEVLNLTRNVIIEGTEGGKAHTAFLGHDLPPQSIVYAWFRHLGPRTLMEDPTQSCSVDISANTLTRTHYHAANWVPPAWETFYNFQNGTAVRLTGGGANDGSGLPAPLQQATTYYVVNANGATFQLASTPGGPPINLTTEAGGPLIVGYLAEFSRKIIGRWPLHFHHNHDAPYGTILTGLLATDNGAHSFVTHVTDGVTYDRCVAHNNFENAFWWDTKESNDRGGSLLEDPSHDVHYLNCVGSQTKSHPFHRGFISSGFELDHGTGHSCIGCVAVGNQGNATASGFSWPESTNEVLNLWQFSNNITHNNRMNGIFVWQNDGQPHPVDDSVIFFNGNGGSLHGAYVNNYQYDGNIFYGNVGSQMTLMSLAWSTEQPLLTMRNEIYDAAGLAEYSFFKAGSNAGTAEVTIQDCQFLNYLVAGIGMTYEAGENTQADRVVFIDPVFSGTWETWFLLGDLCHPDAWIEVQFTGGDHFRLRRADWPTGTYVPEWNAKRIDL
jgi:hypothetical protein